MTKDEQYMRRCLELALRGAGRVAPNPMVGCVLVVDDRIIGEGWHREYGGPHAEVNAVNSVAEPDLLKRATAYVSLEPCSHYGKTPPCADLLVERGIPKVVIASTDDNPEVSGRGISRLLDNGIEVVTGILQREARAVNRPFYTYHNLKRPYVLLKWAQTENGMFAPERGSRWLSNAASKRLTHRFRHGLDAILVGRKTAEEDNPMLTDRFWGSSHPLRAVIDPGASLPEGLHLFTDGQPVLVFSREKEGQYGNAEYIRLAGTDFNPQDILRALFMRNITSVLVEGGAHTLERFITSRLWDEAVVYQAGSAIENGIPAPVIDLPASERMELDGDQIIIYQA